MTDRGVRGGVRRVLRINGYLDVPAEAVADFFGNLLYWLESQDMAFVPHRQDGETYPQEGTRTGNNPGSDQ